MTSNLVNELKGAKMSLNDGVLDDLPNQGIVEDGFVYST